MLRTQKHLRQFRIYLRMNRHVPREKGGLCCDIRVTYDTFDHYMITTIRRNKV